MASRELEDARKGITVRDQDDPELETTVSDAHKYQLALARETNRHNLDIHKADLGLLGVIFGGVNNAPGAVAGGLAVLGFVSAIGFWLVDPIALAEAAKILLGFSGTALGYFFGRAKR